MHIVADDKVKARSFMPYQAQLTEELSLETELIICLCKAGIGLHERLQGTAWNKPARKVT